jgi:tRNA threonylcarbamoyladenosine biosynthesis protein TsaE
VRALARGRGAGVGATSPTFSLVHRYEGPQGVIAHVDCYRFRTPEEAEAVEWELFQDADLLLVEWPARGGAWVPPPDLTIRLSHVENEDRRGLEVVPHTVDVSAHD